MEAKQPNQRNVPPTTPGELDELMSWLKEYGRPVVSGLLIGAVLLMGIHLWRQRQREKTAAAVQALFQGSAPEELLQQALAEPKASIAPLALASAAADFFAQGRYDEALAAYENLLEQYADSLLAPNAELGRAASLEALDDFAGAAEAYEAFALNRADDFLLLQATLGAGRCREQLGEHDEARALYEEYLVAHPDGEWLAQVESSLMLLKKAERARALPPPAEATMLATEEVVETSEAESVAVEEAVAEDVATEELAAEETAIEEPVTEEPASAEEVAVAEEPAAEETAVEEPVVEEPATEEPAPTPED